MKKLAMMGVVAALCAAGLPAWGLSITEYTGATAEADFISALLAGYYTEDFDYAPWTTIVNPAITSPQNFSGGSWAYAISSPSGLSGQPIPPDNSGSGGAVANYMQGQAVTITFSGTLPYAVGGIFWETNLSGAFVNNGIVTLNLASGGTYTYYDSSNWDAFTGYISDTPISSITVQANNFATMDHLIVGNAAPVPEPATISIMGLGLVSLTVARKIRSRFGVKK